MILDLFAGPGGWDEALRLLGRTDVIGIEYDAAACKTRAAAGHLTIRADISQYPPEPFAGLVEGLIASPPCPTFSAAGNGKGRAEIPQLHAAVEHIARHGWTNPWELHSWSDPRTPLVLEPLRWVAAIRPTWIALEQVPACLPLWDHLAEVWDAQGFSTWCGVVNAADYGVPQTRQRAICMAHRTKIVTPPQATHAKHPAPSLFEEKKRWVSMADALGWGAAAAPSVTVTAGGTETGGPAPLAHPNRFRERERESFRAVRLDTEEIGAAG